MSVNSRKAVRTALQTGLQAAVTNAQEVLGYKPTRPDGKSPIVGITSLMTDRPPLSLLGTKDQFDFSIVLMVNITTRELEAEAEDILDDLEQQVAQYIEDNKGKTANWKTLTHNGGSTISYFQPQAGVVYVQEAIPIRVQVF